MDKAYNHKEFESDIYKKWEEKGYFKPEINPQGTPYTIVLPPPNANGDLHFGHAMFVIEDILIRYHRMKGFAALWLPGSDHAGTETQFVYEKKLQEDGKSRFDYSREDLYKNIWAYVQENRGGINGQLKRLGFSLDWSRSKFTLDPDVVAIVNQTFRKMYEDKLMYRDYRLVNYCTRDGTSFSDLEVVNQEAEGVLYYIDFPVKEGGVITIATTRPETFVGDVAVMVNPKDKRYKKMKGKTVLLPFVNREIPIIEDEYVEMDFGTGAVKVTPAHDFNDFEIAKKHNLSYPPIIGFDGKMQNTGVVDGLYVKPAREVIIAKLEEAGLLRDKKPHKMVMRKCYKCKNILEPLPREQWYIKVQPLVENAVKALDNGYVKIYPQNYTHILKQWYAGLRDWNISRQNVWGIQIPVFYEVDDATQFTVAFLDKDNNQKQGTLDQFLKNGVSFDEIAKGLQQVIAPITAKVVFEEQKEKNKHYLPETDTFDTWFSSGQWPYVTLQTTQPGDFAKFYPTSVMETGYDILRAWVSRMIMLGLYVANGKHVEEAEQLKKTIPFKDVVLHGLVNDPLGKKMSKSKGNVVNPLQVADEYGADSVRFALVYGTALGNDQAMSYAKLDSAKKFANKLWNMARFIEFQTKDQEVKTLDIDTLKDLQTPSERIKWSFKAMDDTNILAEKVSKYLDNYQFNLAAELLYEYAWHTFADKHIEEAKTYLKEDDAENPYVRGAVIFSLKQILTLLHPFMPFVTEAIYQQLPDHGESLMIQEWPTSKSA